MENEIISAEYSRAVRLNQHIKVHAEMAQQSLYEMCRGLKEMRDDKLYKELNYQNFEEYCQKEVGLTRMQAYRFIGIADNLSEDFVTSMLQIGTTKLALLAKLDEPEREEIVQNVDLESTTVKELKDKIHQLTVEKSLADDNILNLEMNYNNLEKRHKELGRENMELSATLRESQDTQKNLVGQIERLEDTIEELESRPVEVVCSNNSEEIQELREKLDLANSAIEDFKIEKAEEIENIKAGYEMKINQLQDSQADKSETSDVRAEINAYKKVADDSLHNLYAAIVRQNEYGYSHLATGVIEILKEWTERFDDLGDDND